MPLYWLSSGASSRFIVLLAAVISMLFSPMSFAESEDARINKVKAAFVLNVARFVTWPADVFAAQDAPMVLCYYRSQPFAGALDTIADKTVSGRRLELRQARRLSDTKSCQILLIPKARLKAYTSEAEAEQARPVLIIADRTDVTPGSAEAATVPGGVMVSLVRDGSRIGFEINLSLSRDAGLAMSSQLLKHARIVGGGS
jgi:YfiR/HmsC-like